VHCQGYIGKLKCSWC